MNDYKPTDYAVDKAMSEINGTATNPLQSIKKTPAMQWTKPIQITELTNETNLINWQWKGYIALGHITLLSALMKCGKTTLICLFLKALQQELQFLNQEIKKVNVLIISEEPKSRWNQRREKYGLQEGIWLLSKPTFGKMSLVDWQVFLGNIVAFCIEKEIKLVIVDTLTTFSPVRDENSSSEVTESLLPFNRLLEKDIAVLLIHHLRKSGGEEAIASRGSTALASAVDIILEFRRLSSNVGETQRVLRSYSRDEETPEELVINLNKETNEYEVLGSKQEVLQQAKANVLLGLIPLEPNGITTEDIKTKWPEDEAPNKSTIFRRLKKLEEKGWVKVVGKEDKEKGKPDLWARTIALHDKPLKDAMDIQEQISEFEKRNDLSLVVEYTEFGGNTDKISVQELDKVYQLIKQLRESNDRFANNFPLKTSNELDIDEFHLCLQIIKDYGLDTKDEEPNKELYRQLAIELEKLILEKKAFENSERSEKL